jgi:hypothetical protein
VSAGILDIVAWRHGEEVGTALMAYADPALN